MAANTPRVKWPDGKRFAFTVFDDTDAATLDNVGEIYAMLTDLGFRTTKSCWPLRGHEGVGKNAGQTCADDDYRSWLLGLQSKGSKWAGTAPHGKARPAKRRFAGLDAFAAIFGHDPRCEHQSHRPRRGHLLGRQTAHGNQRPRVQPPHAPAQSRPLPWRDPGQLLLLGRRLPRADQLLPQFCLSGHQHAQRPVP